MKQKHLLMTRQVCSMAMIASGILFFGACAQDGFDDETFETSVRNTQVVSPSADQISIKQNSSGTEQIISWPVVMGAGGFECKVVDESDAANPETIFEQVVDGCTFRAKREDDAKYRIYIRALGNKKYNNTDAAKTTEIAYNTIVEPYKVIPSGTDLAEFFKVEQIPENEINETTKELIAVAYNLEAGGTYTMSDTISFGNHKILLYSTKAGADIKLTGEKAMFQIQNGFTLRNLRIDCVESTPLGLITCSNTPEESVPFNESVYTAAATKGSYLISEPVEIKNCMIKDLKKALVATGENNGWVITSLTIMNNIIQLDNEKDYFLNFYGSGSTARNSAFKELLIQNNTIYNLQENKTQFATRFGNASNAVKLFGTNSNPEVGRFKWQISNNTIMRVFTGKGFGNNQPNNACVINIITDNILIDDYQIEKYALGNQTKTAYNNYLFAIVSKVTEADAKMGTVMDPGIVPPTTSLDLTQPNGGLNLTPSGEVFTSGAGDPRWLK